MRSALRASASERRARPSCKTNTLCDRSHKLVINPPDVNELYDLVTDPHELHNVYDDPVYVGVRDDLMRRLYAHLEASGDNFRHWMTTMFRVE